MRFRPFVVLTLTVGLALLLAFAVAAQGAGVENTNQAVLDVGLAGPPVSLTALHSVTSLDYTSEITFTPAFTTYLPAVFKGYGVCSTISTLISPANGSNLDTLVPLFVWDCGSNPNAIWVQLQVARDAQFAQVVSGGGGGPPQGVFRIRDSDNFDPATTYYWRTRLLCGDTEGPYSDVWSFTTGSGGTILPAPTLIAPANGSSVPSTAASLQWSAVSGAVEYTVCRWEVGGSTHYCYRVNDTQLTISWLSPNTTYEWGVSARNDYAWGDGSETWQFTAPAESLSMSPRGLNHRFVVVDGGTIIVFESQSIR